MLFILRIVSVLILLVIPQIMNAQSVIKEFQNVDLDDTISGDMLFFPNGDILLVERYGHWRHVQLTRISSDLSSVMWSKILKVETIECDFPLNPFDISNNFYKIPGQIFIDSREQIWLHYQG